MNRELKFRVWDNLKKEWISNKHIWRMRTDEHGVGEILPNTFYWKQHPDGLTYQQYTGLKDQNGVEIYEGDIIHYKFNGDSYPKEEVDRILTCSYDEDEGMYSFDDSDHSYYWAEIKRHCNIIGNIMENPELLKA
jgi:uncharacterized phage protein (TIGR01671 family)